MATPGDNTPKENERGQLPEWIPPEMRTRILELWEKAATNSKEATGFVMEALNSDPLFKRLGVIVLGFTASAMLLEAGVPAEIAAAPFVVMGNAWYYMSPEKKAHPPSSPALSREGATGVLMGAVAGITVFAVLEGVGGNNVVTQSIADLIAGYVAAQAEQNLGPIVKDLNI